MENQINLEVYYGVDYSKLREQLQQYGLSDTEINNFILQYQAFVEKILKIAQNYDLNMGIDNYDVDNYDVDNYLIQYQNSLSENWDIVQQQYGLNVEDFENSAQFLGGQFNLDTMSSITIPSNLQVVYENSSIIENEVALEGVLSNSVLQRLLQQTDLSITDIKNYFLQNQDHPENILNIAQQYNLSSEDVESVAQVLGISLNLDVDPNTIIPLEDSVSNAGPSYTGHQNYNGPLYYLQLEIEGLTESDVLNFIESHKDKPIMIYGTAIDFGLTIQDVETLIDKVGANLTVSDAYKQVINKLAGLLTSSELLLTDIKDFFESHIDQPDVIYSVASREGFTEEEVNLIALDLGIDLSGIDTATTTDSSLVG